MFSLQSPIRGIRGRGIVSNGGFINQLQQCHNHLVKAMKATEFFVGLLFQLITVFVVLNEDLCGGKLTLVIE